MQKIEKPYKFNKSIAFIIGKSILYTSILYDFISKIRRSDRKHREDSGEMSFAAFRRESCDKS